MKDIKTIWSWRKSMCIDWVLGLLLLPFLLPVMLMAVLVDNLSDNPIW